MHVPESPCPIPFPSIVAHITSAITPVTCESQTVLIRKSFNSLSLYNIWKLFGGFKTGQPPTKDIQVLTNCREVGVTIQFYAGNISNLPW